MAIESLSICVPRVSVGIPVYNGERYLQTAIESVLAQNYQDFELIISDNASTDRTPEICSAFAKCDSRIRYFRNETNIGAIPNFNNVFTLARGELFKWLSCDDACYPNFLSRAVEVLDGSAQSVALVYTSCEVIDEAGESQGIQREEVETRAMHPHQRLRRVLIMRSSALAICGLIRSSHLRRTKLRGSFVMDDMGLLAELAMVGEFIELRETLLKFRIHPGNALKMHATTRSHAIWLDPANKSNRIVLNPQIGLFLEGFRSVRFLDLRRRDKLCCYAILPLAYCERSARNLATYWKRKFSRIARRLFPGLFVGRKI
jgi:glycosyltransferase involved in cell wall biosynthesis